MNDERAAQGLDHLQAAALEMIGAARAFLDVAEDLVADKEKVADVVAAFGSVADAAGRAARGASPGPSSATARRGEDVGEDGGEGGRDTHPDGVQHIKVS